MTGAQHWRLGGSIAESGSVRKSFITVSFVVSAAHPPCSVSSVVSFALCYRMSEHGYCCRDVPETLSEWLPEFRAKAAGHGNRATPAAHSCEPLSGESVESHAIDTALCA